VCLVAPNENAIVSFMNKKKKKKIKGVSFLLMDANPKFREYILHNNLNGVKEEIEKGCDINVVVDNVTGLPPLGFAAFHLRCEVVSVLIKAKADVNARSTKKNNCSILYNVLSRSVFDKSKTRSRDIIQQLLEANAIVNDFGFKDFTPLAFCCHHKYRDFNLLVGKMFMDYGAKLELVKSDVEIPYVFKEYNTLLLSRIAVSRKSLCALLWCSRNGLFPALRGIILELARAAWAQKGGEGCGARGSGWVG
jgi:ankyrin repeat protein